MERIKKALEKARAARAQNTSYSNTQRTTSLNPSGDLENIRYTQTNVIRIPKKVQRKNNLISSMEVGPEVDAYKILRTNVTKILKANNWNSLAITSSLSGEGKTLTSINLAISMAKELNHTVLLVDMDLRRPSIHKYFGYYPKKGISEVVSEGRPISEVLINPSIDRLVVLPGKRAIPNSSETMSSPKFVNMISELKSRYKARYIIFDMPPVLGLDDVLAFSDQVDAYLLVIENGRVKEEQLKRSYEILKSTNLIGTVLNKTEETQIENYHYLAN